MIKAIIFDCFGVLTSEGWQEFKDKHFGADTEKLDEAQRLNGLADSGKLTHTELMPMIAELAGVSLGQAEKEIDNYQTNTKLFNYIDKELNHKYKIGMLSNVSDDWLYSMFTSEQLALFDSTVLSFEIGYAKPDRRAYEIAAEQLEVNAGECVFIDDLEHNIIAAKNSGMQAIQFINFEDFKNELQLLLADSDK